MLNKSVLALMLSFSMLTSQVNWGGGINNASLGGLSALGRGPSIVLTEETVSEDETENLNPSQEDAVSGETENQISAQAEGETVYIDENFDNLETGEIIRSTGNDVADAPEPKDMGQLTFKAGHRGNGGISCIAAIKEEDSGKYLDINEDGSASSSRGISFVFDYVTAPSVENLGSDILELSMDVTSTLKFTLTGFGTIPAVSKAHVRAIIDKANNKQYVIITDADGLASATIADLTATGFTGAEFYENNTKAQIDNVKVASHSADVRQTTVTVKDGETPIEGAEVVIGSIKATTNSDGEAVFALPYGTYEAEASKIGFINKEDNSGSVKGNITVDASSAALALELTVDPNFADDIVSLAALPGVGVTQAEYAAYKHPEKVEATVKSGKKIDVTIKADSWASSDFDEEKEGVYTWTAEIEAPEDHANVDNLKVSYQMSYDVLRKTTDADGTVVVNTDFENVTGNWDMTGDAATNVTIADDSDWTGNSLLQLATSNLSGSTTTLKNFGTLPKMTTAKMEFEWYTGTMSSNGQAGQVGLRWMSGENELISLYYGDQDNKDIRTNGGKAKLYYSVDGSGKKDTGIQVTAGQWNDLEITFDFSEHKATLKLGENEVAIEGLLEVAKKADSFGFITVDGSAKTDAKVTATTRIDDFFFAYVEDTSVSTEKQTVYSVDAIDNRTVTQEAWEAGTYKHPEKASIVLSEGDKIEVDIDAASWACENFDAGKKAAYTWTADLIVPEEYENPKGLKASYVMEYYTTMTEQHDYYNDFTFASEIWASTPWSSSLDSTSGTGYLTVSHKNEASGNGYLSASVSGAGGGRGTRMDFSTNPAKGAVISFDWMPVNATPADVASGNIDFFSASNRQNYFTLRFDSDYKISYFTKGDYNNTTVQPEFENSISEDDRVDTGLGGQNKWFSVRLTFDYFVHTATLEIAEKDDPSKSYTATVPIEASANGLSIMVMRLDRTENEKSGTEMGLDNVILDYTPFDPDWIVSIKNPADVNVARSQWNEYTFPETVEATMGDNSKVDVPVGEWTAEPAFDFATSEAGKYVWTAPLVPGELKNEFGYSASFTINYTSYPFPTYVYNPNTLELEFGQELPTEFPTQVDAKMSDNSLRKVNVGTWNPVREFNADEEGIYIYGANIEPVEGDYDVQPELLLPNENITDHMENSEAYIYDVYYRISYFKDENHNYNGYERTMEELNRGTYAIAVDNGVFISWRLLAEEYNTGISFDIYRSNAEGNVKVNAEPINDKTNYVDVNGKAGDVYTVLKTGESVAAAGSQATANDKNYMSIPVQKPDPQPNKNGELSEYTLNDMGVADADGDGEYEIIVKWYPNNSFDSGNANGPSSPTIFDVYRMDGTPLWRLNLGLEMPSGAHFNQFMFYDLDEDGCAELFIKTSDGTTTFKPNADGIFDMDDESTIVSYIGDPKVTPGTNIEANGHVNNNSNEYVTVFNGLTGEEIVTENYVNTTGNFEDWGKSDGGNRSARYNIAIAYLPKDKDDPNCTETIPAVLLNRGYYAKTTVIAYTLRKDDDGYKLQEEWNFVRSSDSSEAGKGNHNVSTGDIDKDGFDEIILGAIAIDHDGEVLWVKNGQEGQDFAGHADTIHLAAMNPYSDDLYVFTPNEEKETATMNAAVVNARTGSRISGSFFTIKDVGRAIAANITPAPGYEYWSAATGSGVYGFDGSIISESIPVSMNWRMYWDGDLLSELGDGIATDDDWAITKYNWEENTVDTLATLEGTKTNNSTKKTPGLTADLFGDWREEVALRNDDDTEIRIYMTTYETEYMIYTLMHDPVYRNAVANQNTAYNQPPHVGFYLGEDNRDTVLAMGLTNPADQIKYGVHETEEIERIDLDIDTSERLPEPSETVKNKLSVNTADELKSYLQEYVTGKVSSKFGTNVSNVTTVVWEIAIKLTIKTTTIAEDGTITISEREGNADDEDFLGGFITLPYPENTNGNDYDFVVIHLNTTTGDREDLPVQATEDGLEVFITGNSPIAIGWAAKDSEPAPTPDVTPTPAPAQPDAPDDSNDSDDGEDSVVNTSDEKVAGPAKTGDNMGSLLIVYSLLAVAAAMGIAATIFTRYRRKK